MNFVAVADVPDAGKIEIFTTRIDTIYGATAIDLCAGSSAGRNSILGTAGQGSVETAKLAEMRRTSVKAEDIATAEKEGFFTGRYAINPFITARRFRSGWRILC